MLWSSSWVQRLWSFSCTSSKSLKRAANLRRGDVRERRFGVAHPGRLRKVCAAELACKLNIRTRESLAEEVSPPRGASSLISFRLWMNGLPYQRCGWKQKHSFDGILRQCYSPLRFWGC